MLRIVIENSDNQEQAFFQNLNPIEKDGSYKKASLKVKLETEHKNAVSEIEKKLYEFLLNRLRIIIVGNPKSLNEIITEFNNNFTIDIFYETDITGRIKDSEIAKKLKVIFNYKSFRGSEFCVNYLRELGFEKRVPCPYCNFDELSIVTRDDNKSDLALLDLDHFVPQSKYPFLALSMYNLIPSCHNCNSSFKREILFLIDTHINPFDKSFDEYFRFSFKNPYFYGMDIEDLEIAYEPLQNFCDETIKDLNLIGRYNTAKEQLLEKFNIISKMRPTKKDEIENLLEEDIDTEILELAEIPQNHMQITKYKLGKLKRDVYQQMWK